MCEIYRGEGGRKVVTPEKHLLKNPPVADLCDLQISCLTAFRKVKNSRSLTLQKEKMPLLLGNRDQDNYR